ncbi:MAG: trigger factor [Verrucomicrobiota bacterium]|nr:trigger factor [Verrucomicrobiota bacterium]
MNLSIKEAGTARQIATVTFDAEEIQTKEKEACNEIGKVANIPGFRKGKAPSNVIRKRFSKELNDELTRKLSTEAYESIMENKDFKVYSILKVEPGSIDTNSGTSVDITYDIEPEFEIPDYENFQVTTEPVEVTDEDIDKELDAIREQRSTFEEVDRIAQEGDYIKCSYEGMLDGSPVSDLVPDKPMYGKQSNTWEEAGESKGMGVDAIAKGVVGMKKGDKKEVEAKFDKDFEVPPLAGKTIKYNIEVHEVREKKSPEMNEEFLQTLKVENLQELKDRVATDLENRKKRDIQNSKRSQITQKFLEIPDFPLPQQAVEDESNIIFQSKAQQAIQRGAKQEDIESKKDELWKEAKVQGEARVKLTIILGKIAEKEKVEVSNEDLARAATQEAMMQRKDPTAYIKELSQNRQQLHRLRQDILHDKTLELVADKAKETVGETEDGDSD